MYIALFLLLLTAILFAPQYWAKHTLRKHNRDQYFSGSGIELARILLDRLGISDVDVEVTSGNDHYDPLEKTLRLNKQNCGGKSLTAVVVAAHEVGHAMQHSAGFEPLLFRTKFIRSTRRIEKAGAVLIMVVPFITAITRTPIVGALTFLGGVLSLVTPVVVHLITLPVEWDASFRRALPILTSGDYVPEEDLPAARSILRACALTYLAGALSSLFNFWRWIRMLRR